MANEKQARTQAEANAQVGAAFLMAGVNEITRLETDLAAANATIAAQSLALATMREALEDLSQVGLDCIKDGSRESRYRLIDSVDWAMGVLRETDDAAALAGAVLEAAEEMREALVRLVPGPFIGAMSGSESEGVRALAAYRRAVAALRGHGAVEG